jgi:hypothetical protein
MSVLVWLTGRSIHGDVVFRYNSTNKLANLPKQQATTTNQIMIRLPKDETCKAISLSKCTPAHLFNSSNTRSTISTSIFIWSNWLEPGFISQKRVCKKATNFIQLLSSGVDIVVNFDICARIEKFIPQSFILLANLFMGILQAERYFIQYRVPKMNAFCHHKTLIE